MRNWHSLYEIFQFPIGVIMFALFLLGAGNIVANPAFAPFITIHNDFILRIAEACTRIGSFLIVNFPLFFLIRSVTKRSGSATTILSALSGYIAYLVFTMYFTRTDLPSTAYSSILGISLSSSTTSLAGAVRYPLQTGLIPTFLLSFVTLGSYARTRHSSDYGFFSFINKDVMCVIRTVLFSCIIGALIGYAWPYLLQALQRVITFISADTTNPINLMLYGVLDRFLCVLNLGTLIRTPFWYGTNGGSWLNMAGISIAGDVNIWTGQYAANSLTGITGRFITPYYVLNMFAIPGLIWGIFSINTDKLERRRLLLYEILITLISLFTGCLLPLELTLFFLCPLLFIFHLAYTGILFGVFQAMGVYLGFNYTGTGAIAVMPGTLLEYLTYFSHGGLTSSLLKILLVGVISFFIYFLFTRIYFKYLSLDLFRVGDKDRLIDGTIEAVGGIENVKLVHSSLNRLIISLYNPTKLNITKLKSLGSIRVHETKAGYAISYGAASTMVRIGIDQRMRDYVRKVD